jgi:alkanesulfonate monooxygenase SsuD/methylene tetrahydromethanopterin reductase-like flavin-dependent oxidoreductase (luciferase family)
VGRTARRDCAADHRRNCLGACRAHPRASPEQRERAQWPVRTDEPALQPRPAPRKCRLWTPLAAATGAAGNSTALVGTPETVAQAILDYIDIGVSTILIRGYDPYDDAIDYGRQLLPLVRSEVARRKRQPVAA